MLDVSFSFLFQIIYSSYKQEQKDTNCGLGKHQELQCRSDINSFYLVVTSVVIQKPFHWNLEKLLLEAWKGRKQTFRAKLHFPK